MRHRSRLAFALVLGLLAAAALAAPALAQTSSDIPGGGGSLKPVSGIGELSAPTAGPVSGSLWDAISFALRDRLVPLAWSWIPSGLDRIQGLTRPEFYVAPRRPTFKVGGTGSR